MKRKYIALLSAMAVGGLFTANAAQASFVLRLSTGASNVFIVNDDLTNLGNQRPDGNPDPTLITYTNVNFGAFTLTVTTGYSNSPGGPLGAILQVNTLDIKNNSAGTATLDVQLEDTGFTSPSGNGLLVESSLSGNLFFPSIGDEIDFQSWADASDGQGGKITTPGLQTYLVTSLPPGFQSTIPQPDTVSTGFATNGSDPYSLTNELTVKLSPGAQGNIVGTTSVVPGSGSAPEPASLLLMGLGSAVFLKRRTRA